VEHAGGAPVSFNAASEQSHIKDTTLGFGQPCTLRPADKGSSQLELMLASVAPAQHADSATVRPAQTTIDSAPLRLLCQPNRSLSANDTSQSFCTSPCGTPTVVPALALVAENTPKDSCHCSPTRPLVLRHNCSPKSAYSTTPRPTFVRNIPSACFCAVVHQPVCSLVRCQMKGAAKYVTQLISSLWASLAVTKPTPHSRSVPLYQPLHAQSCPVQSCPQNHTEHIKQNKPCTKKSVHLLIE
jgi:hypothetical protein